MTNSSRPSPLRRAIIQGLTAPSSIPANDSPPDRQITFVVRLSRGGGASRGSGGRRAAGGEGAGARISHMLYIYPATPPVPTSTLPVSMPRVLTHLGIAHLRTRKAPAHCDLRERRPADHRRPAVGLSLLVQAPDLRPRPPRNDPPPPLRAPAPPSLQHCVWLLLCLTWLCASQHCGGRCSLRSPCPLRMPRPPPGGLPPRPVGDTGHATARFSTNATSPTPAIPAPNAKRRRLEQPLFPCENRCTLISSRHRAGIVTRWSPAWQRGWGVLVGVFRTGKNVWAPPRRLGAQRGVVTTLCLAFLQGLEMKPPFLRGWHKV
jgi:hypothetical protein